MTTWIVSTDSHIEALIALARARSGSVVLIDVGCGPRAGVDRVITIADEAGLAEALAPSVVEAVTIEPGDLILVRNGPAERVLAGALAAGFGASVITDVRELSDQTASLGRYGGIVLQTLALERLCVVIADGGGEAAPGGEAEALPASARRAMTVVASQRNETAMGDPAGAERVVAVGSGFRAAEDLGLAEKLAAAVGAELACSRPIAEGRGWMPRESYIGVTGLQISPKVYFAMAISGQLQHLAGVRGAKTIVAVNSDPNAPIFANCDYGIVGDIYAVLPVLTDKLQGR